MGEPIRRLNGVGEKRAAAYEKQGIFTVEDLTENFPRAYEDWSRPVTVAEAPVGAPCCIKATVIAPPKENRIRKNMILYKFPVFDGQCSLSVTLFNNPYLAAKIRTGETVLLFGTVTWSAWGAEMSAPLIEPARTGARIRPIYRQSEGLTTRMIEKNMADALDRVCAGTVADPLPPALRAAEGLCDRTTALRHIHFPPNSMALDAARERLIFEELFLLQCGMLRMKDHDRGQSGVTVPADLGRSAAADFAAGLPFTLTGAQSRAIAAAVEDLANDRPMARLVQGDVGSGKTAVAAGVAYAAIRGGAQAALMAPTEILATQHAETLQNLFGDKVRVALLTGSVTGAPRKALETAIAAGEVDLVVGTHALLTDRVTFARLGLVITDEQHRFGVRQRAKLAAKGDNPHLLIMSATPIPRTLAMMMYGDLDVSVLDELPPGRQPVATFAVSSARRERAYGYVRKHLDEGRQGFIVCPLVEESEDADLRSATERFDALSAGPFAGYRLGLLHGRMKPAEKERTMAAFAAGEIQLLVSTTVIEVGVDVPNAVILVVENAERFGLAQLHQLRGRVGRGMYASTCILISDHTGEENRRRLKVLCDTNDGFKIADEDLQLRGPGDFFGDRQHGLPQMKIADLLSDTRALTRAQIAARQVLADDPALEQPEHQPLAAAIDAMFAQT